MIKITYKIEGGSEKEFQLETNIDEWVNKSERDQKQEASEAIAKKYETNSSLVEITGIY